MRHLCLLLLCTGAAQAEIYDLPADGSDVIGAVTRVTARQADTLVDIARRHGLGYEDIVRANPDLNVWLPGEGTEVLLPTRYVLPSGERSGIILNLAEYRMYYFPEPQAGEPAVVMTYPVSIGRMDWETPLGRSRVISKVRDPAWYPPKSVRAEHEADGRPLPAIVPPGPDNPLGRFAMRLDLPGYLIHGTNRPAGVGMRVTHGCVRMFPEDIEFLFEKIGLQTRVRIINEPIKIGWDGDELVVEVHPTLDEPLPPELEAAVVTVAEADSGGATTDGAEAGITELEPALPVPRDPMTRVTEQYIVATRERSGRLDWERVETLVEQADGVPAAAGTAIKNAATSAASQ